MTSIQELRRHVRLLESHFEAEGAIAAELSELGDKVQDMAEALDDHTTVLGNVLVALDELTAAVKELADVHRTLSRPGRH
jgi:hypothetical protein